MVNGQPFDLFHFLAQLVFCLKYQGYAHHVAFKFYGYGLAYK